MTPAATAYAITRIRLINWHNFVDETIEVANGGHLFLLGDNGSGKTTVLDAIHYVLTAGENLEFNSAARVAGTRSGGRRSQGVVMRHNVETGSLNPAGGITYAALEIAGANGVRSTYAIGLEVYAMDEQIRRWGIIRECPLEDIPLRVERDGELYPASRQEIRDHFRSASGYYANIEGYKREVAGRLFRSESAFCEIARLLAMAKAYREIASHSSDYHELFKRLLPEPQPDIFERIIAALNTLDESAADLERLDEQLRYLRDLATKTGRIEELREQAVRLQWIKATLELADNGVAFQLNHEHTAARQERRDAEAKTLATCTAQLQAVERRIADLQAKDSSGLVRQEKELTADSQLRQTACADARERAKKAAATHAASLRALAKLREALTTRLRRLLADINRLSPKLPFSLAEFATKIDEVFRDDTPEQRLGELPFAAIAEQLQAEQLRVATEVGQGAERRKQAADRVQELEEAVARIRGQVELLPSIPNYATALQTLRDAMFTVRPLYEGLEWQANLADADRSAMEETIGADVFATFVVQEDDERLDKAARLLFTVGPHLRIATQLVDETIPAWVRDTFDLSRSDPTAIRCLAAEMIAQAGPETERIEQFHALRFRGHRRRLAGEPASFIGTSDRRQARERLLRETERLLTEATATLRTIEAGEKRLHALGETLGSTSRTLADGNRELHQGGGEIQTACGEVRHASEHIKETEQQAADAASDLKANLERLELLREKIRAEGLENLDKRLKSAARKKDKLAETAAEINQALGALDNQIKGLLGQSERLLEAAEAIRQRISAQNAALLARRPEVEDVQDYILHTRKGDRFTTVEQTAEAVARVGEEEIQTATTIDLGIRDDRFGPVFNFTYDRQDNQLIDRRSRPVTNIVEVLARQAEEQRELINERTRELFRKLVVGELLTHLREKVDTLRQMVKNINQQLSKRSFGSNQYGFKLQTVERHQQLVKLVSTFNPWRVDEDDGELRRFFEDQREAITNTEVGTVPELLDYRNWFHYDMRLQSSEGDGVVIDRHTKSIGSGGEQAVPNYLLVLTVAHFMFQGSNVPLRALLFDEAFYGIDAGRRDQLLGFASDLDIQLFVASPDQDGVRQEIPDSTTILVVKDERHDVHLYPFSWENPRFHHRNLFADANDEDSMAFGDEI